MVIDFRRVFVVAGLLALVIVYAFLWAGMIGSRSERTGSDFIAFYAAGRVAQAYGMQRAYDPALQQAVQEQEVGFALAPGQVLLYNHVPYLVPLLTVLVGDDYGTSFVRWALLLLTLFVAATLLLAGTLRRAGWGRSETWLAAAGMLTFFPLFVSLMNGQDTALTTLGLCLCLFGLRSGRDRLAGLGLALTTVRPHLALFLALPFLFRRRQVFVWFGLGAALLGLVSLAALGLEGMRGFANLLLVSAGGDWYGLKQPLMVNLVGLLWRAAPGLGATAIRATAWSVYGLALAGMCLLWGRSRDVTGRHFGLAVVLALFTAPHLHYHDLTLLLVPLAAGLARLVQDGLVPQRDAALIPLAVSLALLFSNFASLLKYDFPFLVMFLLGAALWYPRGKIPPVLKE